MQIRKNEVNSQIMGDVVADLVEFSPEEDFQTFEQGYLREMSPRYVVSKVPIEDLRTIHGLESEGFRFIEFQIRSTLNLRKGREFKVAGLPYAYGLVETEKDVEACAQIAKTTFTKGRFGLDPELDSASGGDYYYHYTLLSHRRDDELLHKLVNLESGELVAFNTCRTIDETSVQLLNAGVKVEYKGVGLGTILNYYVFNDLLERGLRHITTHQSGVNYAILNVELGHFNFRVVQTFAVMRKIYR